MRTKLTVTALLFAAALLAACGASGGTAKGGTSAAANVSASPQPGSFVAFCPGIHVRFWAPPAVMPSVNPCQGNSLFLTTNIANTSGDEYLTVFRYSGDARGQSAAGWLDVLEGFHRTDTTSGDTAWSADSQPSPQAALGAPGFIGHFTRTDKGGMRYAGTLWVGQIGSDTVAILGQGSAQQQTRLDKDMAQVLRTLDLDAQ